MPMASSGQLSLGTTAGTDRSIGAAVSGYTNTSNISLKDASNNATAGTDPADGAPFEMGEFYNYAEFIPHTLTRQASSGTGSLSAARMYKYTNYNGFGVNATNYAIRQVTTFTAGSSGGWTQKWYVQELFPSVGYYVYANNVTTFMTVNALYQICEVFFPSTSGKPDTFRLNFSSTGNNAGLGIIQHTVATGPATYHSPPNTDHTFYPTGTSSGQSPSDFKIQSQSNDECWDGTKTNQATYTMVYKKSGYADTTVGSFYIRTEHEFNHTGLCP